MGKVVTTSSCSKQDRRSPLRRRAMHTKRIQPKRGLSKSVQSQSSGLESIQAQVSEVNPQGRPKPVETQSGEYKRVQSQQEKHKPVHPKCVQPKRGKLLRPGSGKTECVQSKRGKLFQPGSEKPECVQPKRGKLIQPSKLKGVQPQSGKSKEVQPLQRKPTCIQSQSLGPKFILPRRGRLIHRRGHPKPLQPKRKKHKPTQPLPGTPQQPFTDVPVSLRIQTQIAIKNSQEDIIQEVSLTEKRKRNRMNAEGTGKTFLHTAAFNGCHTKVKTHLKKGRNPNSHSSSGWTPLHDACLYGYEKVVRALLKGEAIVDIRGPNGETPLFDAVTADNFKIVKLLLKYGADPHIKNFDGLEPSYYANTAIKEYLQNLKGTILSYLLMY
ncbi:ankyrin repeat domain-containing protein 11 [Papilio machaon]|uniref:ankyrin repeat domain-containing protein 11 n=1 Tax=Papilio machaon TaxID=76193 RepID=UPI001E662E08|nr:ankyrin repeat domain-containing protein 11 [Papilio machaon]